MSDNLLPCPFDGGEAYLANDVAENGEARFSVTCRCCAAEGGWGKSESAAVRNWNTRPAPSWQSTPTPEQIEANHKKWADSADISAWMTHYLNDEGKPFSPQVVYFGMAAGRIAAVLNGEVVDMEQLQEPDVFWHPLQPNGFPVGVPLGVTVQMPEEEEDAHN